VRIVVQKFGGTSVASHEGRLRAAEHIERAISEKYGVVVVVSAMGRKGDPYATDTLLKSVNDTGCASKRDLDILMSCGEAISAVKVAGLLRSRGHDVVVLSGQQAGIMTNAEYGRARILDVQPLRILEALNYGQIVIVMGFQGATESGDITTLDRGGSDTTAAALGSALHANCIDIFTDVEGIMTADPRIVPDAVCVQHVSYKEACNLAYHGAKVIHPRAVEMAMQKNVPLRVRSTFSLGVGTLVTNSALVRERVHKPRVTGVTQKADVTWIQADGEITENKKLVEELLEDGIHVSVSSRHENELVLSVSSQDSEFVLSFLSNHGCLPKKVTSCAEIAVILPEISHDLNLKGRMNRALSGAGIHALHVSDESPGVVWGLVYSQAVEKAVRALYQEFQLEFRYDRILA
jgi:aspartate kinase